MPDLFQFSSVESQLTGWDACIWGLGISSLGLQEEEYAKVTEELTLLWAETLLRFHPDLSFCYCSAMGAGGAGMWARVRQRVEGGLKTLPYKYSGCVRPGFIQPGPGIRSKVRAYQAAIVLFTPLFPLLVKRLPIFFTTSAHLGRAMHAVVQGRADRYILESSDINRIGALST